MRTKEDESVSTKALPDQQATVLYTTGAIHKQIKRLFASPAASDRRVAVVAYVGADALALLPTPKGIDVVCSPTPLGTSHVAVKALIKRGAIVRVADRLHMKVYWSERRGCVITSANLSTNALGKGGLKEAGVYFLPGVVDIDRILNAAKPRPITKADMNAMARGERRAASKGLNFQPRTVTASFLEWYDGVREDSPKIAWWVSSDDVQFSKAAREQARREYGVDPYEQITCEKNQIVPYDWLLCIELSQRRISRNLSWMFIDFVVPVEPTEAYTYEAQYPFQAVQVHPLKHYSDPPFRLTSEVKRAFSETLAKRGIDRLRAQRDLSLSEGVLAEVTDRLRNRAQISLVEPQFAIAR